MRSLLSAIALSFVVLPLSACPPPPEGDGGPDGGDGPALVLEELEGALLSVNGTASDDVWVVGADARDGSGPYVLHYDGAKFVRYHTGDEGDLWWVNIAPDGDVWMVGDEGRIFRFDPASETFTAMQAPDASRLYGVFAFADDDVWAVGGEENDGTSVVWHYDGSTWAAPADLPAGLTDGLVLFKVWGTAPGDLWIVGQGGAALRYQGGAWSRVESIPRPLFTVHGNDTLTVAVGGVIDGLVMENSGNASLEDKTPELAPQLNGVYVNADGSAVASGYEGAIWQRSADGAWSEVASVPTTLNSYHAVYQDPDGGIWAVGGYLEFEPLQQGMLAHLGGAITSEIVER